MNAPKTITQFRCEELRIEQTRSSCAARWESHNGDRAAKRLGVLVDKKCVGCVVGEAHANGDRPERWPDGRPLVLLDKPVPVSCGVPKAAPLAPPVQVAIPKSEPRVAPPAAERRVAAPPDAIVGVDLAIDVDRLDADIRAGMDRIDAEARRQVMVPVDTQSIPTGGNGATITIDGETLSIRQWSARVGISEVALRARLKSGWSEHDACTLRSGERPTKRAGDATIPKRKISRTSPVRGTMVTVDGRTQSVEEWMAEVGITWALVRYRMSCGETLDTACSRTSRKQQESDQLTAARQPIPIENDGVNHPDTEAAHRDETPPGPPAEGVKPDPAKPRVTWLDVVEDFFRSVGAPISRDVDEDPVPDVEPKRDMMTPAAVLRAAGYEVQTAGRTPAGWVLVITDPP